MKNLQFLLCLLIKGHNRFFCVKPPFLQTYRNNVFRNFAKLLHGTITTTFNRSCVQSIAAKLDMVWLRFIARIGFATRKTHFCAAEIYFYEARNSFFVIVRLSAANAVKKSNTNSLRFVKHPIPGSMLGQYNRTSLAQIMLNRKSLNPPPALQFLSKKIAIRL